MGSPTNGSWILASWQYLQRQWQFDANRELAMEVIKTNLHKAQERMKHYVDKHGQDRSFQVGDMVYLKL